MDSIFSGLSGQAFHFGLIYWIKSSYHVVKRMQISISDSTNALNKIIYRYDVTRYYELLPSVAAARSEISAPVRVGSPNFISVDFARQPKT